MAAGGERLTEAINLETSIMQRDETQSNMMGQADTGTTTHSGSALTTPRKDYYPGDLAKVVRLMAEDDARDDKPALVDFASRITVAMFYIKANALIADHGHLLTDAGLSHNALAAILKFLDGPAIEFEWSKNVGSTLEERLYPMREDEATEAVAELSRLGMIVPERAPGGVRRFCWKRAYWIADNVGVPINALAAEYVGDIEREVTV